MTRNKTVAPKPAPAKAKRVKKSKPELRSLEHRSLGKCIVRGVYVTDGGGFVVDVDVTGAQRTLSLAPEFWLAPVDDLLLEAVKRQPAKAAPAKAANADEEADGEHELELNAAGHFSEGEDAGEAETEDGEHEGDADADDAESETESEELIGADA
jgi:hypothetical protein